MEGEGYVKCRGSCSEDTRDAATGGRDGSRSASWKRNPRTYLPPPPPPGLCKHRRAQCLWA